MTCQAIHPRDGDTCTRPSGHAGDHHVYDPTTGFSRVWSTQ